MKFANIEILLYGVFLIAILSIFYIWSQNNRSKLFVKFADKAILDKITPRGIRKLSAVRGIFVLLSLIFLIFALARPQWGFLWKERPLKTLDIMIALDTSKSMLATDIHPDRLRKAKKEIMDFARTIKGDRVGLIAFSGKAFLQCPLTMDYSGFALILSQINVNTIPRGGTSLSAAIEEAIRSYTRKKDRILILITDGENTEGDLEEAVKEAVKEKVKIFCIGIGSDKSNKIPLLDNNGSLVYLKDKQGNTVLSSLDPLTLKKIAEETGGVYIHASNNNFGLMDIYNIYLSGLERYEIEDMRTKEYTERFQLFLAIALICMGMALFMGGGKR